MLGIITDALSEILASILEAIGGWIVNWAQTAFFVEKELSMVLSSSVISKLSIFVYSVSVALVSLKFLQKGFKVYILNRDGDADTPPGEMLQGALLAIVTSVMFPLLYEKLTDIAMFMCDNIVTIIMGQSTGSLDLLGILTVISPDDCGLILLIIWLIMLLTLYFQFIKRGAELLVLRLGFPFATLGLIDSDGGVFKPYVQQFFKSAFTVIIQVFCINVSLALIALSAEMLWVSLMYSIGFLMLAKSTPAILNQFLIPSTGGSGLQKVGSVAMTVNSVKGLFR